MLAIIGFTVLSLWIPYADLIQELELCRRVANNFNKMKIFGKLYLSLCFKDAARKHILALALNHWLSNGRNPHLTKAMLINVRRNLAGTRFWREVPCLLWLVNLPETTPPNQKNTILHIFFHFSSLHYNNITATLRRVAAYRHFWVSAGIYYRHKAVFMSTNWWVWLCTF